jgi:hypothetical protein
MKKKNILLPLVPDVPGDLNHVKLKEFFNWRHHELVTKQESENLFEEFKKETLEKVNGLFVEKQSKIMDAFEQMKAQVASFTNNVHAQFNDFNSKSNKDFVDFKTLVVKKLGDLALEFDLKIKQSSDIIKGKIKEESNSTLETSSLQLEQQSKQISDKISELNTKFFDYKQNNDLQLLQREFEKKTREIEDEFSRFQNMTGGLNEEIKAEFKELRDVVIPELKSTSSESVETFKNELTEKMQNMDPVAVTQAAEERMGKKMEDLSLQIEAIGATLQESAKSASKSELNELHDNFTKEMKKIIDWINFFNTKV